MANAVLTREAMCRRWLSLPRARRSTVNFSIASTKWQLGLLLHPLYRIIRDNINQTKYPNGQRADRDQLRTVVLFRLQPSPAQRTTRDPGRNLIETSGKQDDVGFDFQTFRGYECKGNGASLAPLVMSMSRQRFAQRLLQ